MAKTRFAEKVVVITGASRGLGLLLAREFAGEGARLALLSRDRDDIESVRADPGLQGCELLTLPCDVTSQRQVNRAIGRIGESYGRIDVVVNNAGVIKAAPFSAMSAEDFEQAMGTHFWGPLYMTWASLPHLRRQAGRLVNISSIGGALAVPHLAPYVASKYALAGLSESLTAELAEEGVRVTTVYPITIRTGSPFNITTGGQAEKEFSWFALGDSLPVISKNADRAARQIVNACAAGQPRLIVSTQARLAIIADALFPNLISSLVKGVNRLLPEAAPDGPQARSGWESQTRITRSPLTRLTRRAAAHNREMDTHVRRRAKRRLRSAPFS